jgi:hypothetical protein
MAKYLETQMDGPTIKVCCAKATWNNDDKVFMSYELAKQLCANYYDNEVKIYQSWAIFLEIKNDHFLYPLEMNMSLAVLIWAEVELFFFIR